MIQNSYITDIKNQYNKIDNKWLHLQFNTVIGLVVFGFVIECILETALYDTGTISIGLEKFIFKYLLAPLACNATCIAIGYWATRSSWIKQNVQVYIVSLLFVVICFVFYTVHSLFVSLYLIFTVPILMTVVYEKYKLTTVISFASIFAYAVSNVFINWDPEKTYVFGSVVGAIDFVVSICILFAFYAVCIVVIRFEHEKNFASIQKEVERIYLQQKLLTDELTSIGNRTAFRNAVDQILYSGNMDKYIFVMTDLDNFKMLNDKLGHIKGDQCLKCFADILKRDCVDGEPYRFGGDEFCIIFKNQALEKVIATCKAIQWDLNEHLSVSKVDIPLTASFGIAQCDQNVKISEVLSNADCALYRSKKTRNAIHVYDDQYDYDWLSG